MTLLQNVIAVAIGFVAGASWLWLKDTFGPVPQDELDAWEFGLDNFVSFDEYSRVLDRNTEQGYILYAIDLKREEYAAHKHTVYRKVARELDEILFPVTGTPLDEA